MKSKEKTDPFTYSSSRRLNYARQKSASVKRFVGLDLSVNIKHLIRLLKHAELKRFNQSSLLNLQEV